MPPHPRPLSPEDGGEESKSCVTKRLGNRRSFSSAIYQTSLNLPRPPLTERLCYALAAKGRTSMALKMIGSDKWIFTN